MLNYHPKIIFFIGVVTQASFTSAQAISEAQRSLQQLNHKISVIQKDLSQTHTQQADLQRNISTTNALIKKNGLTLGSIQQKIPSKQKDITRIEQKIHFSQQKFTHLQTLLMKQVQARYQQEPHQALQWVFHHPQSTDVDKLLTYYQYTIHAHEEILQRLKTTQADLEQEQHHLQREIENLHRMQAQVQMTQQQLQVHQHQHQNLLRQLHEQALTQETTLSQYERNRDNLSQIVHRLSQQSVVRTQHAMGTMKRKLPNPVNVDASQIHSLHQGIMLYSAEGTPVHSVYPGKVVFCEWLNGYGLLLIVDHGWGLMSLYANNLSLTKQMGDVVNQGDQIATVGHGGISKQPGLYFEVRKNGKAISPLDWLKSV